MGAQRGFCRLNPPLGVQAERTNAPTFAQPSVSFDDFCSHHTPKTPQPRIEARFRCQDCQALLTFDEPPEVHRLFTPLEVAEAQKWLEEHGGTRNPPSEPPKAVQRAWPGMLGVHWMKTENEIWVECSTCQGEAVPEKGGSNAGCE
ncbi:MAG TPA: hypothetical protein VLV83_09180 [Acidobacteriota bacterium]|nr:hypothetical protein [Acidobacteriota bacterium]